MTDTAPQNEPDFTQPTWWWLSFADTDRAENDHFSGVAIVQVPGVGDNERLWFQANRFTQALNVSYEQGARAANAPVIDSEVSYALSVARAWELHVNPGGQVVGFPYFNEADVPGEEYRNRLLSKQELIAAGLYVGNIADNGGWENYL